MLHRLSNWFTLHTSPSSSTSMSTPHTATDIDDLTSALSSASITPTNATATTSKPPLTIQSIANLIKSGKCTNIIAMTGAGISTSCGIPDFRSPTTGLYANLQRYNLPHPEAIFDIQYFRHDPRPFYRLMHELMPKQGKYVPSYTHFFLHRLHQHNRLLRNYTQNIDGLELLTGMPPDKLVQAHGGFQTATCLECSHKYDQQFIELQLHNTSAPTDDKDHVVVPHCIQSGCSGVAKPDIVFFGEALPRRFFSQLSHDFSRCDLLLVCGTSLLVQPFASLINRVSPSVPRVLINRDRVGESDKADRLQYNKLKHQLRLLLSSKADQQDIDAQQEQIQHLLSQLGEETMASNDGFDFDDCAWRDVFLAGDCDEQVRLLSKELGWDAEIVDDIDKYIQNNKTLPTTAEIASPQAGGQTVKQETVNGSTDVSSGQQSTDSNKGAEFAKRIASDL